MTWALYALASFMTLAGEWLVIMGALFASELNGPAPHRYLKPSNLLLVGGILLIVPAVSFLVSNL